MDSPTPPTAAQTPFNGFCYTLPSHLPESSWRRWSSPRRLSFKDAVAANEEMAAILDYINPRLADRVRWCRPGRGGLRCGKWRFCAFCGPLREEEKARQYRTRLVRPGDRSHLTMTTRSARALTPEALADLVARFGLFRREPRFRQAVAGGVVNFQIDYGVVGWLPHVHAVLDYRGGLSNNWIKTTWMDLGGGYEVKLQAITPGSGHQVLSYGARRPDLPLDLGLMREFYVATSGFRHIQPWGTFFPTHGRKKQRQAPDGPGRPS